MIDRIRDCLYRGKLEKFGFMSFFLLYVLQLPLFTIEIVLMGLTCESDVPILFQLFQLQNSKEYGM